VSGKAVLENPEAKRMLADMKRGHITGRAGRQVEGGEASRALRRRRSCHDEGARCGLSVERVAPAQAREAGKVRVVRMKFRLMLDGQRCQMGVRGQAAADPRGSKQFVE